MAANFTFVGSVEPSLPTGSSTTFPFPAQNVTAGNLLVVMFRWEDGGVNDAATVSVADTAGNTFTLLGYQSTGGGSETERIGVFYVLSALGNASNVITGTLSSARSYREGLAAQYSYDGTIQLGDTGSGLSTTDTTTVTSSPALNAVASDLVVGCVGNYNSNNLSPNSGFTLRDTIRVLSWYIDQIVATPGTFTPGGTLTSGSGDSYVCLTAVFEEAGGGATSLILPRTRGPNVLYHF